MAPRRKRPTQKPKVMVETWSVDVELKKASIGSKNVEAVIILRPANGDQVSPSVPLFRAASGVDRAVRTARFDALSAEADALDRISEWLQPDLDKERSADQYASEVLHEIAVLLGRMTGDELE